ncbi:MAG: antiporter [Peptoniphilus harei]|uniref:AspT/YidE/YbjL antiporter duplication domain protein n=1 Tax=Peptoniphilus harei ACS-146-V-Sch2b TaxID=908338 RepID=E4KWF3_9FIRM|nr:antiporter [Peptoniphilus harei]EFR33846.1 AspT/YidE/YbjL antiporter duplication domain protein [Peptoniphilus harei ACS-146-V-Sch2b]MDK7355280.1 antiporter [Peptoniphilus harei]MDK7370909.1 antiporter [Peptoniphilus harei]MDK7755784.1 antiporter [Peptoniphilus harei]MDK7761424.1 antiporter [Peptoniphilus harei]
MKELLIIFLIMVLGYALGHINFFGLKFGASAILIVALFFGHFGFEVPKFLASLGLVLFLAPIGLMAGPSFMANIKKNGLSFLTISFITVSIGGVLIVLVSKFFDIDLALSMGLATGAMTSTSMLGTVKSLTTSNLPGVGYGIAYAFGVVGVVLIVQLIPRLLKVDVEEENKKLILPKDNANTVKKDFGNLIDFENNGLFAIALASTLGILLGSIKIPIGNVSLSLGAGGGSLIAGLVLGHYGRLGRINLVVSNDRLALVRDLGLAFFLLESGVSAGTGFVEVVSQYGIKLFFAGVILTLVPALISLFISYKVFKLPLFAALGATTGSMTSAPSLGALLQVTNGDDKVSSFYAATQPTATVMMVFLPQIINIFFPMS